MKDNSISLLTSNGNSNRLPYLLKELNGSSETILNFGSGKHYKNHEAMFDGTLISFDAYVEEINELPSGDKFDIVVCSNVLNVIPDDTEIENILNYFDSLEGKKIYISVYEGDKSNVGKITKIGTYQSNRALKDWTLLWNRGYKRIGKYAYKEI